MATTKDTEEGVAKQEGESMQKQKVKRKTCVYAKVKSRKEKWILYHPQWLFPVNFDF